MNINFKLPLFHFDNSLYKLQYSTLIFLLRKLLYTLLFGLVLITSFIYTKDLHQGAIIAKQLWFILSVSLLIIIFLIDLLLTKIKLSINNIDIVLIIYYLYYTLRTLFTPYIPVTQNSKFTNITLLIIFYFIVKFIHLSYKNVNVKINSINSNIPQLKNVSIFIIILCGFFQSILGYLQIMGKFVSFHPYFKLTGTFFNPAPFALYLSVIFPIVLNEFILIDIIIKNKAKNIKNSFYIYSKYYFYLSTIILILSIIPATLNRASWISIITSCLFICNFHYKLFSRTKSFLKNFWNRTIFALGVIFVVGLISYSLYIFKLGSSEGRLLIWNVTVNKLKDRPLFGYGVSRFESEYNNWQAQYFQDNPQNMDNSMGMVAGDTKYCFNEFLEMASEIGLIGLILFFIFLGFVLYYAIDKNGKDNSTIYSCTFSIISFIIIAFISYPFYSLPTHIIFFFLLAIISSEVTSKSYFIKIPLFWMLKKLGSFLMYIILIFITVFSVSTAKINYYAYEKWKECTLLYSSGDYKNAVKLYDEIYQNLKYCGSYLTYYGKTLFLNGEYLKCRDILNRAVNFSSDEILYNTLGDTNKALNRFIEAECCYKHSIYMVPHKLYSRYLLSNLYAESNQHDKAYIVAIDILTRKIKIDSSAVEEIRNAMKERVINFENKINNL